MPELILRTRHADGRTSAQPLSELAALVTEPGATYTLVDAATGETPEGLSIERKDEDLEIRLEGEAVVVLDDSYGAQTSASFGTDESLAPTAELALTSADLPAVSEAGALDVADLPHVSDGGFFSIPAGATLLNPASWGTGALVGTGTVVAAGVGTGVGVAVADDDDDDDGPANNTSTVVFDLVDGDSSDHSDQTFDADTTYTIYIRVPSEGGIGLGMAPGERWSGGDNLGADDLIVLVGDGGPVQGVYSSGVTTVSTEGDWIYWSGSEGWIASVSDEGWFYRAELTTSITSEGSETFTTSYTTTTSTPLWTTSETGWSENPNSEVPLSQAYLTTMPAGVLTSQGLA